MAFARALIFCIALLVLAAGTAAAQPPEDFRRGFGVSPMRLSVEVLPGGRGSAAFSLWNSNTQAAAKYVIEVAELGQDETGRVSSVPRGQGTRSCVDWIDVPSEVQIPAGASRRIDVPIRCPSPASGAYYAILNVATAPSEARGTMTIAVRPTLGVVLEVTIPRPATSHLETQELTYEPGESGSSPALVLEVQNTGVWKKALEGDVVVYDRPGQFPVRTAIPFRTSGNPFDIYPGMTLKLRCPLPRTLDPGVHRVSVRLHLTQRAKARKDFELKVPGELSGASVTAQGGEKVELDVDVAVEPDLIEVRIPPGGRRTVPIRVHNRDTREAHLRAQVTQARMEPNGMFTYLESNHAEAVNWVSVSPDSFDLAPARTRTLLAQVAVPKSGGAHLPFVSVVRLQAEAAATAFHDDWSSKADLPVIIVAQHPRAEPARLDTVSFEVVRPNPELNPSAVTICVKNTGGEVARAFGRIVLERTTGQEIARMDIGASQSELILPGSEREFRMPLPPLDKGQFRVRAEIAPGGKGGKTLRAEKEFSTTVAVPEGLKGP